MFQLDPTLEKDSHPLKEFELCTVRLINDARFLWVILVPKRQAIVEITDLKNEDRLALWEEINQISELIQATQEPHKLNVAALGNMVRQLHIHIIARNKGDAAWPTPVWGVGDMVPYEKEQVEAVRTTLFHM